jgi:hypothetical protein
MTPVDDRDPPAPDRLLLVVESFLDGEHVDLQELREALAEPAARDHLVDVLALRRDVWASGPHQWSAAYAKRESRRNSVTWMAAAAVVLSLATGYLVGHRSPPLQRVDAGVEVVMDSPAPPPPQPTHIIALKPGVNWKETSGGR